MIPFACGTSGAGEMKEAWNVPLYISACCGVVWTPFGGELLRRVSSPISLDLTISLTNSIHLQIISLFSDTFSLLN